MKSIAIELKIAVPTDQLRVWLADAAESRVLAQTYYRLRGTPSPSRVVEQTAGRLVIQEPSFDPVVRGHGLFQTGWTITYELEQLSPEETLVGLEISYSFLTALSGFGLIRTQAQNEIIQRVAALLAFESGFRARRADAAMHPIRAESSRRNTLIPPPFRDRVALDSDGSQPHGTGSHQRDPLPVTALG